MKKFFSFFFQTFELFWEKNPALLSGLLMLCAALCAFGHIWALLPLIFIFLTTKKKFAFLLFFLTLFTIPFFYQLPDKEVAGRGLFTISTISEAKRGGWIYRGTLSYFNEEKENSLSAKHLSCYVFSKKRYPADTSYFIEGTLKEKKGYSLKSKKEWIPFKKNQNLIEKRIFWKEQVRSYLHSSFYEENTSEFLGGLITGEIHNRMLFKEFSDLGLSHLLAISGFHFSLLAFFLHFFLRPFLKPKKAAFLLIGLLTAYLFFLGNAPSIQRAWTGSILFFLGHLIEKRTQPLNSLGAALMLAMIFEPSICQHVGFQLSFLATGALLILTQPLDRILQFWIPKRLFKDVIKRSLLFQHGYIMRSFFREALALGLAVNGVLLPLLLSIFHQFSWHSLLYNLFFPFLVSLSLLLFLFTVPLDLIFPFLGKYLHKLNNFYTHGILNITENPPLRAGTWYIEEVPDAWVAFSLTFFFTGALLFSQWLKNKKHNALLEFSWV